MGWGSREEWKLGERRAWGMGECGGDKLMFVLLQVLCKWQKQCLPICIPNRTGRLSQFYLISILHELTQAEKKK